MEQAAILPRRNPVRAAIKAVLHIIVKTIVLVRRAILRHPFVALMLLTMLIGGYFALETGLVVIPGLGLPAAANDGRPPAIARYIDGQRNMDVTTMWEAMSDEMRTNQEAFSSTQQQLEYAKSNGIAFGEATYVGGSALENGRSVHLFVLALSKGTQVTHIPYTFTLDQAGKILNIE